MTLPVVITEQGETLVDPTDAELASTLGLTTTPAEDFYDLVVIGGGPAGLAAAVYGASEGLKTVLIERTATGGQAGQSSRIENYLGFPDGLSGPSSPNARAVRPRSSTPSSSRRPRSRDWRSTVPPALCTYRTAGRSERAPSSWPWASSTANWPRRAARG